MPLLDNHILDRFAAQSLPRLDSVQIPHAELLLPEDRRLIEWAIQYRLPHRKIAQILHLPAGTVTRRLHRVLARLADPLVRALVHPSCALAQEYRQLAIEHFLQGLRTAQLSDLHQISTSQVRAMLTYVRGWYKGHSSLRASGRIV